jgi:hypothetical protein
MYDGEYGDDGVGSIEINQEIYNELLNDSRNPFGHAYSLGAALLDLDIYD